MWQTLVLSCFDLMCFTCFEFRGCRTDTCVAGGTVVTWLLYSFAVVVCLHASCRIFRTDMGMSWCEVWFSEALPWGKSTTFFHLQYNVWELCWCCLGLLVGKHEVGWGPLWCVNVKVGLLYLWFPFWKPTNTLICRSQCWSSVKDE